MGTVTRFSCILALLSIFNANLALAEPPNTELSEQDKQDYLDLLEIDAAVVAGTWAVKSGESYVQARANSLAELSRAQQAIGQALAKLQTYAIPAKEYVQNGVKFYDQFEVAQRTHQLINSPGGRAIVQTSLQEAGYTVKEAQALTGTLRGVTLDQVQRAVRVWRDSTITPAHLQNVYYQGSPNFLHAETFRNFFGGVSRTLGGDALRKTISDAKTLGIGVAELAAGWTARGLVVQYAVGGAQGLARVSPYGLALLPITAVANGVLKARHGRNFNEVSGGFIDGVSDIYTLGNGYTKTRATIESGLRVIQQQNDAEYERRVAAQQAASTAKRIRDAGAIQVFVVRPGDINAPKAH